MKEKEQTGIIPEGNGGKDITVEVEQVQPDLQTAIIAFQKAKIRLLDVNRWDEFAGKIFANFQLMDAEGQKRLGSVMRGDYIKIDILGPGSHSGDGNDWVFVEEMEASALENGDFVGFRVRPISNPTKPDDDSVAHFYDRGSTSSFTVTRTGEKVIVGIYDKNIEINTDSDLAVDNARNRLYGAIAKTFFSKVQWELLAEGILRE